VTEIERAHLQAIAATQGPILLETQFFRHKPIAEALADAANRNPHLTCMMILPAAPEDVAFYGNRRQDAQLGAQMQMDCIDIITQAFEQRLALASPAQATSRIEGLDQTAILHDAPIIYVHSKLSLFGGHEAILSSANLNGRSMRWDTEAGIHLARPNHVTALWDAALRHWFPTMPYPDPLADQLTFIAWVRVELAKNMVTTPEARPHFLLPFPRGRDTELAKPVFGVPDEIV
ncbi:MAG: phospholipase D-like domain-containing protein, partial [Pseudomonadota bacterium]